MMGKYGQGMALRQFATGILCLLYVIPFIVLLSLALEDPAFTVARNGVPGIDWKWDNFKSAWMQSNIGLAMINSAVITIGSVVILVGASSMAGFIITRHPDRFSRIFFILLIGSMMIPGIVNTVPLYSLLVGIGGINRRWSMMLVCATNALPFAIFLFSGFIKTIPKELDESAIIDGCHPFRVFLTITLPLLKPVIASVIILNGIGIWNNYGQAVFFLQSAKVKTIPLAISLFFQQYGARWNLVAAAATIGIVPAIVVFLLFQKLFIKGITAGAVKG